MNGCVNALRKPPCNKTSKVIKTWNKIRESIDGCQRVCHLKYTVGFCVPCYVSRASNFGEDTAYARSTITKSIDFHQIRSDGDLKCSENKLVTDLRYTHHIYRMHIHTCP